MKLETLTPIPSRVDELTAGIDPECWGDALYAEGHSTRPSRAEVAALVARLTNNRNGGAADNLLTDAAEMIAKLARLVPETQS